jgi:hypothetical protein
MKFAGIRFLLVMAVMSVTVAGPVWAQKEEAVGFEETPSLVLTATVLSQKCLQWNNNLAELKLRLQFNNAGNKPLILNKRDVGIIGERYFALIDEEKDDAHIGETASSSLRGYVAEYDEELVSEYPNSNFVVLSPGQSYVAEETASVPLIRSTGSSDGGADQYRIEVSVSTWAAFNPKLADQLQQKWKKVGVLWSKPIWSKTVEFAFERKRTCEK